MFTKEDYRAYFEELSQILKKTLVIYTDLINEIDDKSVHNKLYALTLENMSAFEFISKAKEDFA